MDWQTVTSLAIVAAAVLALLPRMWRSVSASGTACGGCNNCPSSKVKSDFGSKTSSASSSVSSDRLPIAKPLVQIEWKGNDKRQLPRSES